MTTINQILTTERAPLGHWGMWANDVVARLDGLRITPKRKIAVDFEPVEYRTDNGRVWHCQHWSSSPQIVPLNIDDSELRIVCDSCNAQLIGEEWINGQ